MTAGVGAWLPWALGSAFFAAATAICAKVGIADVDSDLATLLRTVMIAGVLAALLAATGRFHSLGTISPRSWVFLAASALATGASWICYFRALSLGDATRVAPVDKLSVVLVAVRGASLLGEHLSARGWLGVVMIASGVVLVALA